MKSLGMNGPAPLPDGRGSVSAAKPRASARTYMHSFKPTHEANAARNSGAGVADDGACAVDAER